MAGTLDRINIGRNHRCFVIAEAGVNHNGDVAVAKKLIRAAKASNADCVKFQTFSAERVVTRAAPKAAYQLRVTDPAESQFAMLKGLELSRSAHKELLQVCADEDVTFLSTPYNIEDAELLADLGVKAFKLASIHLVELPFLRRLARMGKPMIVSTGMATLAEVDAAVRAIRDEGNSECVVLQCTTNYPSMPAEANLRAMSAMGLALDVPIGYSDHTEGIAIPLAAAALGARVIEKHFTLDRSQSGPDHRCSSEPGEFAAMVAGIRDVEAALGSPVKAPTAAERQNMFGMRRSITTRIAIAAGTVLTDDMLTFKRPAIGLAPAQLDDILGKTLLVNLDADVPVLPSHIRWSPS